MGSNELLTKQISRSQWLWASVSWTHWLFPVKTQRLSSIQELCKFQTTMSSPENCYNNNSWLEQRLNCQ